MPLHRSVSTVRRSVTALVAALAALALVVGPVPSQATAADAKVELVREVSVIGTSVDGREIRAIHRYWKGVKNRKKLVVIGSVHGNEPAGVRVAKALKKAKLPRNVELWVIPTANPDGLADKRRTNARKVDLNRNFPYRWKRINVGTSTYSGRAAASEPETKALITFFKRVKPDQTVVFHQPLHGVGTAVKRMDVVRALAKEIRLPVKSFACTGVCHGSFSSWHNRALPGVAVTVEFGRSASKALVRRSSAAVLKVASRY
jgi:protein MpaA